jgi:hypothetical protein
MAAIDAGKGLLRLAIGLVDRPTFRTSPAGVAWIDGNDRDAFERHLVTHQLAKLTKAPPVQTVALRPSGLNVLADVGQVFARNRAAGAFGLRRNLLGDAVVHVLSKAGLLSAKFLQTPLGAFAAMTLQGGTANGEFLPDTFDVGTGIGATIAVIGEVDDSEIDAAHVLDADLFGVWYVTDNREMTLTTDQHQIDFALARCEQSALAFAADERNLHPADDRPDAHHIVADQPEYAIVVGLGCVLAGIGRLPLVRWPLRLTGVGHLSDAAHHSLGCQLEGLGVDIDELVQMVPSGNASIKGMLRNRIAGSIAALKRIAKQLRLLWAVSWMFAIRVVRVMFQFQAKGRRFCCRINPAVSAPSFA